MRFLILILLIVCLIAFPAQAQGPTTAESLHIALWPEFDDPRLLVILDGVLSQNGATVRVPIPSGAELNAVATADSGGGFLNADFETEAGVDGQIVVFSPQNPIFRIEYYAPLTTSGDQRQVAFSLPAGYLDYETASIEVLTPPDATNVVADPPMQAGGVGTGGGQLFQRQVEGDSEQGISQEVSYSNAAGALTVSETARATTEPVAATAPPPSQQSAASTTRTPLLVGLGLAALLLIAGGVYGLWRTRQPATETVTAPGQKTLARSAQPTGKTGDKPRPSAPVSSPATASGQDRFCRQCGAEFQRNDRFCRQCGTSRQ